MEFGKGFGCRTNLKQKTAGLEQLSSTKEHGEEYKTLRSDILGQCLKIIHKLKTKSSESILIPKKEAWGFYGFL